jgi:TolB-like protein/thioredoxin-like negative regulator of GroEL
MEIDEALRPDAAVSSVGVPLRARRRSALRAIAWTIAVATALLVVFLGMNLGGLRDRLWSTGSSPAQRLVVLPLRNLTGDPDRGYFVEGVQERLSTELGTISALDVISHTSALSYKDTDKPLPQIVEELNVKWVVEGSVRWEGDKVRISVRLIDGQSDRQVWEQSLDRELQGILVLHSDVARAIAGEIRVELTPQEQTRLASARPVNPEAYDAYAKGRYYWNQFPASDRCVEHFQQAIERAPDFADAYAGLGSCYLEMSWGHSPKDVAPKAKTAAEEALKLDSNQGEAYTTLGNVNQFFEWDWVAAEHNLSRAMELSPNSAYARMSYSKRLLFPGRYEDAIREGKRALELDPVSVSMNRKLSLTYMLSRRFREYAAQSLAILELAPGNTEAKFDLAWAYALQGMREEALAVVDEETLWFGQELQVLLTLGERGEAVRSLEQWAEQMEQLAAEGYRDAFWIAVKFATVGEPDSALEWLERAYDERSASMVQLKTNPALDPIRDDPRFQDLLRRMNYPE